MLSMIRSPNPKKFSTCSAISSATSHSSSPSSFFLLKEDWMAFARTNRDMTSSLPPGKEDGLPWRGTSFLIGIIYQTWRFVTPITGVLYWCIFNVLPIEWEIVQIVEDVEKLYIGCHASFAEDECHGGHKAV
jgi:hypothetical protein